MFRQSWGTNKCVTQKARTKTYWTDFLQQLHRSWNLIESFAASFVAMNFIGGVRCVQPTQARLESESGNNTANRAGFFLGLLAGGPAAVW